MLVSYQTSRVLCARTVSARLDRCLDIPNALDGDAVLVVSVDVLILKLANLVQEDAELVRDVRDIFVASLAPDRQLLLALDISCWKTKTRAGKWWPTATSMRSFATVSKLRITFFSILTSWASFLARSGPKAPAALRRRAWPDVARQLLFSNSFRLLRLISAQDVYTRQSSGNLPKPPRPKRRPDLVLDGGGGGFCEAAYVSQLDNHLMLARHEWRTHLDLRSSRRPRGAHRVCAMHCGGVCGGDAAGCGAASERVKKAIGSGSDKSREAFCRTERMEIPVERCSGSLQGGYCAAGIKDGQQSNKRDELKRKSRGSVGREGGCAL